MNITDLIVELIHQGEKIVLPGIGTLDSVEQPPHHDTASQIYYPATRAVRFSTQTDGADTMTPIIAQRECVSNDVARQMWNNYLDALIDKVKRTGSHQFGEVGTLSYGQDTFSFAVNDKHIIEASSTGEVAITNVKTYDHSDADDPFAQFETAPAPAPVPEPTPAPAPEPAPQEEHKEEPTPEPEAQPSKTAEEDEWQASLRQLDQMPKSKEELKREAREAKEREKAAAREEKERMKEMARAAKERAKRESEERRQAEAALSKAERKAEEERIKAEKRENELMQRAEEQVEKDLQRTSKRTAALEALAAARLAEGDKRAAAQQAVAEREAAEAARRREEEKEKEAERMAAEKEAKARRKAEEKAARKAAKKNDEKDHKSHKALWLLLAALVVLGGTAYYFFGMNRQPQQIPTAIDDTQHLDVPTVWPFSFNPDMIDYSEREIASNRDLVCINMTEYINAFLADRNYAGVRVPMMDRVRQYAEQRLNTLLGPRMAVQRFIPYDDYIYRNAEPWLKITYAGKARTVVQGELMNDIALDEMLDQLIDELGLEPGSGNYSAEEVQQVKQQEQETIAARQQRTDAKKDTKDNPVYVYVEKESKQGFDIVAGFYLNKNTAAKMTAFLHEQGCDAYIIEKNEMFYVSMGSAPTRTKAEALYNHIKSWYDGDIVIKEL